MGTSSEERYRDGMLAGIRMRARSCKHFKDVGNGSCDSCTINKYNKTGMNCRYFMATKIEQLYKLFERSLSESDRGDENFIEGFKKGMQLVSAICATSDNRNCSICPLRHSEDELSCDDIMIQQPELIYQRMMDMTVKFGGFTYNLKLTTPDILTTMQVLYGSSMQACPYRTYYDEFCLRFPESGESLDIVSANCCRDIIFNVDSGCETYDKERCRRCWMEQYGD